MERLIKHLRYSLILMGLLFSMVAKADVWGSPKVKTYYSENKEFKLHSDSNEGASNNRQVAMDSNPNYDKSLAEKLGGDDYGMKSYFLVILKTGTNATTDQELIRESFRGHLDNINKLVSEEKMVVAGPLGSNDKNYRGIFILNNIASIEEANEVLQTDPAINNGLLDYEIFTWYGSAALPEYLPAADKIWKLKP